MIGGVGDVSNFEFPKKLYNVKGRKRLRITQTEVSWKSLNEGDVFVLECKDAVWCWVETDFSGFKKIRGMEFARKIKEENKQGKASLILAMPDNEKLREKFYDQLNRVDDEKVTIKSALEREDDEAEQDGGEIALYRICDGSEVSKTTQVGTAPLNYGFIEY